MDSVCNTVFLSAAYQYDRLYSELAKLMMDEDEGNMRVYTVCANCEAKLATIGIKSESVSIGEEALFII